MSLYHDLLSRLSSGSPWSDQNESSILEPYTYLTSTPGKDIRTQLISAFNVWLQVPDDKRLVIARLVSMLHNASLMIDDIQDDAQLRRGLPVAHKIYGVPQTINTANYVYFLAFKELFELRRVDDRHLDVDAIVTEELLSLHRGQGLEMLWRDSLKCPTEEEYIGMVNDKTGGLLRIGIKLMMVWATTNRDVDLVPLVNLIGVYFQIRDDLMNLRSKDYTTNKGFAEDLTEGKFSFPVVHAVQKDLGNRVVINILQKRPTTPTLKIHAISHMETVTKSFEYTMEVLSILEGEVRKEIARLGGNALLEGVIDILKVA
ncbi:isoprenoid synthase domain-containing protein [Mycena floridula]|nr:isoprenoid synthase domain-containing protein [Mycena floridula]